MKTKTWVLTALAILVVATGFATDFPKMNVVQFDGDKALVAYNANEATPLEITLSNKKGDILYFKRTKERHSEYKKVFNFSQLGDGEYTVCMNFGNRSVSRAIKVKGDDITVGATQRLYEPCFKLEDGKLDISMYNGPQKRVYVNIYRNGKHVEGINLGHDLAIQKRLDLTQLKAGKYEVVVTDFYKDHKYIAQL